MNPDDPTHESHVNKLNQYDEIIRNFYGGPRGITKMMERLQPEVDEAEAVQGGKWAKKSEEEYGWMFSERQKEFKADLKQKRAMEDLMATKGVKNIAGKYRDPIWQKDPKAEPWIDFTPAFRTATDIAKASLSDTDLEEILKAYGFPQLIGNKEKYDDYKKEIIRLQREQNPELSADIIKTGFMHDPGILGTQERFAGGGIANLTRTVAPDSGPMSRGLSYLYNRARRK